MHRLAPAEYKRAHQSLPTLLQVISGLIVSQSQAKRANSLGLPMMPFPGRITKMEFDDACEWNGSFISGWAHRHGERIRCQAGRASISKLGGFTQQIGLRKDDVFRLLKDAFTRKIELGKFDAGNPKSVTLNIDDLVV